MVSAAAGPKNIGSSRGGTGTHASMRTGQLFGTISSIVNYVSASVSIEVLDSTVALSFLGTSLFTSSTLFLTSSTGSVALEVSFFKVLDSSHMVTSWFGDKKSNSIFAESTL